MRLLLEELAVSVVDKNRRATSGVTTINVAPPVANHVAFGKLDPQLFRGAEQHSRAGLAEFRLGLSAWIVTNFNPGNRQQGAHSTVNVFYHPERHIAATDVRLVSDHNQLKPGAVQPGTGFGHTGQYNELF